MITAEKLTLLTNMPSAMLSMAIQQAGYKEDKFTGAKFLGITNGGQFCYLCTFPVEGGTDSCKVFLTYDPTADKVTAGY